MVTSTLAAALVVVGAVAVTNLLLTFGVIRRLREHTGLLADRPGGPPRKGVIAKGEAPGDFVAMTTAAEPVSTGSISGGQLVGFFMPGCAPCKELAPRFVATARAEAGGRDRVLAVVAGDPDGAADLARLLEP